MSPRSLIECLEPRTLMAVFTVTGPDDVGIGSLRQAVIDANNAAGADTIDFSAGLNSSTISLTSGQLVISDAVSISGPGASKLTISGTNTSRIFQINPGVTASIKGLTLTGGNSSGGEGGAVSNSGTLTLNGVTISANTATFSGGLLNAGTLSLVNSTISGNTAANGAGALRNAGAMTITGSTISGNTALDGGGISNSGTLTITNSAITGNHATNDGGGIYNFAPGTLVVSNSTLSGNNGDHFGGAIITFGSVTLTNSTVSGNTAYFGLFITGGGLNISGGATTLISTLVSGNPGGDIVGGPLAAGSINNLVQDAANNGGLTHNINGNLIGVDPLLGALASYGGPTQTMALPANSPAIGTGLNPYGLINDQRGSLFTRGTAIDIGAYQRQTLSLAVDTLSDAVDGIYDVGNLSLREAVAAAANPGNDTIIFAPALNGGTITLGGTELTVTGDVTITGPGANLLTISGNMASRVFNFVSGTSAISGLTIAAGQFAGIDSGGGLYNDGTLTVTNVAISGSTAFSGGGVYNGGTLAIAGSTLSGNFTSSGGSGGGVLNTGTMTITNSTIAGNTAGSAGGFGGGIFNTGMLTIANATIAGNTSNGGPGGGIYHSGGTLIAKSTIVAGNTGGDVSGTFAAGSTNNLVQNAASAGGLINNVDGNLVGVDPLLGTLARNGGSTRTMALLAGSPAIAKGINPGGLTTDQRGGLFARGATVDIGAFQRQTFALIVDTLSDADDGNYSAGNLSLREAITVASNPGTDTITFASALNGGTIALSGTALLITGDLSITGPGAALLTVNGNGASHVLSFTSGTSSISGLTITGGGTLGVPAGGGISSLGTLTITNSTISGNSAQFGGGIYNQGTMTITGSTLSTNTGITGGAIYNGNVLTITNSTISGNSADNGGGIFNSGVLTVTNSTILVNSASNNNNGGGIYNYIGSALTITNSTISGNSAQFGGGIYNQGTMTITGSTLSTNTGITGGAIYNGNVLTITNSSISGNTADNAGGGIYNYIGGTLTITNSTISGNAAGGSSGLGGGIGNDGTLTINNSTVAGNSATGAGGGILMLAGSLTAKSTIVAGNTGGDVLGAPFGAGSTNNLIQDAATAGGLINNVNGNLVGVDPLLGTLAGNGGSTRTMALLTGSPAIAKGINPSSLTTDQRGVLFARGTLVDIGAYQRQTLTLIVDTLSDADDGNYSAGNLSLREAVAAAGPNPGNDTITFSAALNNGTITLGGNELIVAGDVTITGPGIGLLTISGNGASRVFQFASGTSSLSGLTITGGLRSGEFGGGIYNSGTLTVSGSNIAGNSGGLYGGGIFNHGTMTITNSTISGNTAYSGGGIYSDFGSTLTVINSTLSGNTADIGGGNGGGIHSDGTMTLATSTISGNAAAGGNGGGVYNGGTLTITNSTIAGNTGGDGGGIGDFGTLTVRNSTIAGNLGGGGLFSTGVAPVIVSTIVSGNAGGDVLNATLGAGSVNNLIKDAATAGGLTNNVNGNLVGVNPLLGALANNGGPTGTFALLAGSPAINKGANPSSLTTDQRGTGFARVRGTAIDIGAYEANVIPTIASLTPSASSLSRGQLLTLTANTVADVDGSISAVNFYLDANANGIGESGELLGTDTSSAGGYTFTTSSLTLGNKALLAVAVDNDGALSTPKSAAVTITNVLPTLGSLSPSVATLVQGEALTLTAVNAADGDGSIASVSFYADADGDGIADAGELLGTDSDPAGGYTLALSEAQSYALPSGAPLALLAVATDNNGGVSTPSQAVATVLFTTRANPGRLVHGAADAADTHRVVTVNRNGHVIVFQQGWTVADLHAKTAAPLATGDAVIWVDPKDTLTYVAAPSAAGLILFTRSAAGTWSFRNLTTETSASASPTNGLTQFTSIGGVVSVAGLASDGRILSFEQTLALLPGGGFAFKFVDITADLLSQGQSSPSLAALISYVPSWDAWHLAGIDQTGRIQSVWINLTVPGFNKWRTDDLTTVTGAPAITGQLAVTLTSWGGINLTGLDTGGSLLTTWWVPSFGGNWVVNNLTTQFSGAPLTAGRVSGYTTPWGGLNYVGLAVDGTVTVYWWAPGLTDWNVSPLLPEGTPDSARPTGTLTSSSSSAGTLNVYGTSNSGRVLRLWWQPSGANTWASEDLTTVSVRN